jgi:hypothetical protein
MVMGVADGVVICGEGLASSVQSTGSGFAHAFTRGMKKLRHHPLLAGKFQVTSDERLMCSFNSKYVDQRF